MALPPRTKRPLPGVAAQYVEPPPAGIRIGIALSGGGIRSAAFNLGALQALQGGNVLDRAEYLAAVSGGNYVASALTISGAYSQPADDNGVPLWGRGSAEERYLREHTDYLAPGGIGRIWLGLSVIYGFVLNYLPFLLSGYVLGRLLGWPLHALGLTLTDLLPGGAMPRPVRVLVLVAAGAALAALLVVALRRFTDGNRRPSDRAGTRAEAAAASLVLVVGLVVLVLALPVLAWLYRTVSGVLLTGVLGQGDWAASTAVWRLVVATTWLVGLLCVAVAAIALSQRFRARRLMLVLSSIAGGGLLLVPMLSSLDYATWYGLRSAGALTGPALALLVLLFMSIRVHNRRYSMHLFYRERLNSAFALRRTRRGGQVVAEPIAPAEPLYFSEIGPKLEEQGRRLPKLIVCCAVNLTAHEVPVGRFAASFTFEHDRSGGGPFPYRATSEYEERAGIAGTQLTLPSIMAVSGAALSPLMGRFTYPPLRFLMALTNVRLGVWIKNPLHRSSGRRCGTGRLARTAGSIRKGWHEPGALYVLREALGGTRSTHRFIYLTDGGHWENLGLVELLRRRCTHVLCFDASVDQGGAGLDLGRAMALARSELGADIDLDPAPVLPDANGLGRDTAAAGRIRYPDQQDAKLVYARAVLTEQSSWDLHAFRARDARFPNHSTTKQFFSDEQFEAYRTLGYEAGRRALELLNIPDPLLNGNGAAPPSPRVPSAAT
jgi:hypothetical protein